MNTNIPQDEMDERIQELCKYAREQLTKMFPRGLTFDVDAYEHWQIRSDRQDAVELTITIHPEPEPKYPVNFSFVICTAAPNHQRSFDSMLEKVVRQETEWRIETAKAKR